MRGPSSFCPATGFGPARRLAVEFAALARPARPRPSRAWLSCSARMYAATAQRSRGCDLRRVVRHLAEAVRDHVVEVADAACSRSRGSWIRRRPLVAALDDRAVAFADRRVARRAVDVEALLAAVEQRLVERHLRRQRLRSISPSRLAGVVHVVLAQVAARDRAFRISGRIARCRRRSRSSRALRSAARRACPDGRPARAEARRERDRQRAPARVQALPRSGGSSVRRCQCMAMAYASPR